MFRSSVRITITASQLPPPLWPRRSRSRSSNNSSNSSNKRVTHLKRVSCEKTVLYLITAINLPHYCCIFIALFFLFRTSSLSPLLYNLSLLLLFNDISRGNDIQFLPAVLNSSARSKSHKETSLPLHCLVLLVELFRGFLRARANHQEA